MKGSDKFTKTIKSYLESRGSKDPLFARIITKPGKNIDDCITYILNRVESSGCNGFTDDEVYSMAIHYFDEDNLQVGSERSNMRVVVNHKVELTEEEKAKAKADALEEVKQEAIRKMKTRSGSNVKPVKEGGTGPKLSVVKETDQSLF
jgi:uncharacterized protein (UPF0248 family)